MVQTPLTQNTFFGLDISNISKVFYDFRRQISKRNLIIEFKKDSLIYSEARYSNNGVQISKLNSIDLPDGSVDRGSPIDPELMANLIKDIIKEERIWAHRVAIVLPPEASLCKTINLPLGLSISEARSYINDSSSGFQFPIPLQQTDYDIVRLDASKNELNVEQYFLCSVPKKIVDNIIKTADLADLEIYRLELSLFSHSRIERKAISLLNKNEYVIFLELTNDCSNLLIHSNQGPILVRKLAATREFPIFLDNLDDKSITLEEAITTNEKYFPISELDLNVLINEIRKILNEIKLADKEAVFKNIFLNGVNSSHPNIDKLINNKLSIKTSISRAISSDFIDVDNKNKILQQELGRSLGLSLSMLENEKESRKLDSTTDSSVDNNSDLKLDSTTDSSVDNNSDLKLDSTSDSSFGNNSDLKLDSTIDSSVDNNSDLKLDSTSDPSVDNKKDDESQENNNNNEFRMPDL